MNTFIKQVFQKKPLNNVYKAIIFLDRDGTVIKEVNYLHNENQIELLPKAVEALQLLQSKNMLLAIITNQPAVARGLITIKQLRDINNKFVEKLKMHNIYINAVYSCPHHPNGNIIKYRMECTCRKPNTTMYKILSSDFRVDIKNSFVVGD